MGYFRFGGLGGPCYKHSGDGGATWDPPYSFGPGGMPFIGHTGCALHVIYQYGGKIHYCQNLSAICGTVGIPDVKSSNTINIYPNPNAGNFNLPFHLTNQNSQLFISDITGRVVYHQTLSNSEGSEIIDASQLNAGIYFWEMASDKTI